MRKSAFHTQKSYSSCHKSVFFLTLCYNVGRPNEGLNIKLERWCIHMKKKICSFITRFGGTMAALALVVATMTANSTCLWLSHQPEEPEEPEEVKMLKKD